MKQSANNQMPQYFVDLQTKLSDTDDRARIVNIDDCEMRRIKGLVNTYSCRSFSYTKKNIFQMSAYLPNDIFLFCIHFDKV